MNTISKTIPKSFWAQQTAVPSPSQLTALLTENHWLPDEDFLFGKASFSELGMSSMDLQLLLYDIQMRYGLCLYHLLSVNQTWEDFLALVSTAHQMPGTASAYNWQVLDYTE